MTNADWTNLALTVAGVGGLLLAARYIKPRLRLPVVSPWLPILIYNGLWAALLLLEHYTALSLPGVLAPIGIVGGNGVLVNFFGLPSLSRSPDKAAGRGGAARGRGTAPKKIDPDREPLVPKAKKKRRHKRR